MSKEAFNQKGMKFIHSDSFYSRKTFNRKEEKSSFVYLSALVGSNVR